MACVLAASAAAQTAKEVHGSGAGVPLHSEPPAKIVIDPPSAEPLRVGAVVIQYHTENLHLAPVFGPSALSISPRVGHVHVSVDDAAWVWADASGDPLSIAGLPPGPHKIRIQLMNANHQRLDEGTVRFVVQEARNAASAAGREASSQSPQDERPAKIVVDSALPEPLSRGVVFIRYRTENMNIIPVFGLAHSLCLHESDIST
jgi:hypothetical protein